jgi:hypothetical protein
MYRPTLSVGGAGCVVPVQAEFCDFVHLLPCLSVPTVYDSVYSVMGDVTCVGLLAVLKEPWVLSLNGLNYVTTFI